LTAVLFSIIDSHLPIDPLSPIGITHKKGKGMISSDYNFERFVKVIREKGYYDAVYLAEQEATEAWRTTYREQGKNGSGEGHQYQQKLIGLIEYLRHGIKPKSLTDSDIDMCSSMELNPEIRQAG
jgi:hypothetical protein